MDITQVPKLFTHEDAHFGHLHKILGVSCLVHIFYRIYLAFECPGTYSGLYDDPLTIPLTLMHAALHISSFQFALSVKRVRSYNIIWPEMRVHSLIFAYRSVCSVIAHYMFHLYGWSGQYLTALNILFVYLTMFAADLTTHYFNSRGIVADTTIRGNPFPDWTPRAVKTGINLFYSFSQVVGTMNIMFGTIDQSFMVLIPIQFAPLGMTLVRKGIIRGEGWHVMYLFAIFVNYAISTRNFYDKMIIFTWALLRFKFGINKYALWTMAIVARAAVLT